MNVLSTRFGVAERWLDRVVVVAVSGDLDMRTAPEVIAAIQNTSRRQPDALIVDLSRVDFLAVAGINLLIAARRDRLPGSRFAIVAAGPAAARSLAVTGVDAILPVYRTLEDAMKGRCPG